MAATADPDLTLLQAWQDGDQSAGELLLGRYFPIVHRFLRGRAMPRDVDDLVQATFLDCLENRDRVAHVSFRAFILKVARFRFYDHLRARKPDRDAAALSQSSLADLGTTPSRRVVRDQEKQQLLAAMEQIPSDHQIILELSYWETLSGAEIAEALEIAPGTVRSRLTRARQALREQLTTQLGTLEADALLRRLGNGR